MTIVEGLIVKKLRTIANPQKLAQQLTDYFPGASVETAYEAGFSGFVLHRVFEQAGIHNIVVNPGSIEIAVNNRVKTDQRDALKIATLNEAGRLKGIRVPSLEQEQHRLLTRTRQQLVEERNAIKNKIRMKCHQMGLIDPEDRREMSHQLVSELLTRTPSPEFTLVIESYWQIWKSIEIQITAN